MTTFLSDKSGVLVSGYGNAEFSRDVIEAFVEIREELSDNADLLYPQMGTLAGAVRQALEAGDIELPLRICRFLDAALRHTAASSEIENAVALSFVEAQEL